MTQLDGFLGHTSAVIVAAIGILSGAMAVFREIQLMYWPAKTTDRRLFWGFVRIAFVVAAGLLWGDEHRKVVQLSAEVVSSKSAMSGERANLWIQPMYSFWSAENMKSNIAKKEVPCDVGIRNRSPYPATHISVRAECAFVNYRDVGNTGVEDAIFTEAMKKAKIKQFSDLGQDAAAFGVETMKLSPSDLKMLTSKAMMFFMATISYQDNSGLHTVEMCKITPYPPITKTSNKMYIPCTIHNTIR
jgi:hypothetical protein